MICWLIFGTFFCYLSAMDEDLGHLPVVAGVVDHLPDIGEHLLPLLHQHPQPTDPLSLLQRTEQHVF